MINYQKDFFEEVNDEYDYLTQLPPKSGKLIFIDTETTGLNYKYDDHIVNIGASLSNKGILSQNQFEMYIRPRKIIEDRVVKIHGITQSFFDDYYQESRIDEFKGLSNFLDFVDDSIIFCHNAPFHKEFLNKELNLMKLPIIPDIRFRCSLRISRNVIRKADPSYNLHYLSLENCCDFFNIKYDQNELHNALNDSILVFKLAIKLYEKIEENRI